MDNIKSPTHILLIGRFVDEYDWRTITAIPCFSEEEAVEYSKKYTPYGKQFGHQCLIAKYS